MKRRNPFTNDNSSNAEELISNCESNTSSNDELKKQFANIIDGLLTKSFSLKRNKPTAIKKYDEVKLELIELEAELNRVKSQIPSDRLKEWRLHTKRTHPMRPLASYLSQRYKLQCCSQAFCKFYEILTRFPDLCEMPNCTTNNDELRSLHLCEAPGAFISALNVYLHLKKPNLKWLWKANSLNPHYEWTHASDMFLDDELILSTHCNWLFGDDNSGDILKWNQQYLTYLMTTERPFHLITADGSLYCQDDPSNQEHTIYPLLQSEIKISLSLLEPGGSLIAKMYTMFREETVTTVAQLMPHFDEIDLFKPSSSKPGNSEVYLICRGYSPKELKDEGSYMNADIAWTNILECCKFFFAQQTQAIEFNIGAFEMTRRKVEEIVKTEKKRAQESFKHEMEIANFERINQEMWLKSNALYDGISAKTEYPWRFDKANDIVERLRDLTYDRAIRSIEQILMDECLHDQLGKDGSQFLVDVCLECNGCEWLHLMEQGRIIEPYITFGLPSPSDDGIFVYIRHSLFVDVSVIPLAEATQTHLFDLCESSFLVEKGAFGWCELIVSNGCSLEVYCNGMTQQDWLNVLMQICRSRFDNDTAIKTLSVKSNRPILILSRFAASVVTCLTVLFSEVSLMTPVAFKEGVGEVLCCRDLNRNFRNYKNFYNYLHQIDESLKAGNQLLMQFVPFCQLACEKLYSTIRHFNTTCVMQIFYRISVKYHANNGMDGVPDPSAQLSLTD